MENKLIKESDIQETPAYYYSLQQIQRNYNILKKALPESFRVFYSVKANPHPQILESLGQLGAAFDVSSLNEINTLKNQPVISFVGPGKREEELEVAIKKENTTVVVESLSELLLINRLSQKNKLRASISLRVHPESYFNGAGRLIQKQPSQFGIDENQLSLVIEKCHQCENINLKGLHFYVHSQVLSTEILLKNFSNSIEVYKKYSSELGGDVEFLNIGGGFGIPYFEGQEEVSFEGFKEQLKKEEEILKKINNSLVVSVESGRFLVGDAGFFVTRVLYRKESYGKTYLIVDGGLSNHLAATGFGQFLKKNFKYSLLKNNKSQSSKKKYQVAGPSCYSLDVIANDIELPEVEEGDLLCIHYSGAYGPSFSPQNFLGLKKAKEYFVDS